MFINITLKGLKDKFKEEELLKVDGIPQNKIVKIEKFAISKLLKSLIKDNVVYYYISTSKILPKGFGIVFLGSKGFGDDFPESLKVLTSQPEFISSINPKYFDSCFIILIRFL